MKAPRQAGRGDGTAAKINTVIVPPLDPRDKSLHRIPSVELHPVMLQLGEGK